MRKAAKADITATTESGKYVDGEALNKAFGLPGVRVDTAPDASFVLHGDDIAITTAAHFSPEEFEILEHGKWVTLPKVVHRWATWVIFRHVPTDVIFIFVITHLQHLPLGANTVKKYDQERHDALALVFQYTKQLQQDALLRYPNCEVIHAIVTGDMNSKHSDPFDSSVGVSLAAKEAGFKDAGSDYIDRSFYSPGVEVADAKMIPTNGATDHVKAFAATFKMYNNKA